MTRDKLIDFQIWYKTKYDYQSQCKFHDNTSNFLEWLYKRTGNEEYRKLKEILERPQKSCKKLNPILIREIDIRNKLTAVWRANFKPYQKLRYIAGILFVSYTGQRPDATIGKLTFDEFREVLSRNPPLLWIPEEKDKERFPHWVPLHPVVVEWVRAVLEFEDIYASRTDKIFPYAVMEDLFSKKIKVYAVHTGLKITYSHLRKFFEQMCNNVLVVQLPDGRVVPAMHPGLRDYIMAHNIGSLDVQSYDGKLPSEIYEQYMMAWKDVNLVPEEVRLETLIKQIEATSHSMTRVSR